MNAPTARAERFAAKLQRISLRIAGRIHADYYELLAPGEPELDGRGGRTVEPKVVENGACKLRPATVQGAVRLRDGRMVATGPYRAQLPRDSIVRATHRVRINGRMFTQTAPPRKPGETGLFTVLELEDA